MSSGAKGNKGVPQLSTNEKLEQIRSGKKLERRKSRLDIKAIVLSGKDGSKIIKKQTAEKYEETTVKRKKRNYVMYESKLGTEKNTEVKSFHKPKPKPAPRVRTPGPRKEERIIIVKKRPEFLDNYQYHETKILKKNKPSVVEHQRLASAINIYDGSYTTISNIGRDNSRMQGNKSEMIKLKKPAATTTNFYKKPTPSTKNVPRTPYQVSNVKSGVVTRQIMSRRNASPQSYKEKTEFVKNNNSRTKSKPQTPYQTSTSKSTKTTVVIRERDLSRNEPRNKVQGSNSYKTITVNTRSRRRNKEN